MRAVPLPQSGCPHSLPLPFARLTKLTRPFGFEAKVVGFTKERFRSDRKPPHEELMRVQWALKSGCARGWLDRFGRVRVLRMYVVAYVGPLDPEDYVFGDIGGMVGDTL